MKADYLLPWAAPKHGEFQPEMIETLIASMATEEVAAAHASMEA